MQSFKCLRVSLVVFLFIFVGQAGFSQDKKEPFRIPASTQKLSGSHYDQLVLIDARADTVNMGFVQVGMMNTQANIYFKIPLQVQLSALMGELTDASAQKNSLYFQLRKFSLAEQTGATTETGIFQFRAGLYRKADEQFIRIDYVDTVLRLKASGFGDVTKSLLMHAGNEIIQFIQQNLLKDGLAENSYSLAEIENPDSVDKSHLKLYTAPQYTEGLYRTYQSFAAQTPDGMMTVEEKKDIIKSVKITDSTGKLVKVKSRDVYAMVYKGQPYVATSYDFYPLTKNKEDFWFTGKVKGSVDPMAGVMFGLMGSLLSSSNYYTYEMKIDPVSGAFIRVRYIPDPQ